MEIRIEELSAREVIYAKEIGPYSEKAKQAWNTLWEWYFCSSAKPPVQSCVGYGLDSPRLIPSHMLRYFACLEFENGQGEIDASSLPETMGKLVLAGGRYAIHRMKGNYQDMPDNFAKMHEEWLPQSGEIPDYSRPFLEIYLNNPNEVGIENALTDLCLPIREKQD